MRRRIRLHSEARRELVAAGRWYERRSPGVGSELHDEAAAALANVLERPEAWPLAPDGPPSVEARQVTLGRFPYRVVFVLEGEVVLVLAVAHLRRRPGYWSERLP